MMNCTGYRPIRSDSELIGVEIDPRRPLEQMKPSKRDDNTDGVP